MQNNSVAAFMSKYYRHISAEFCRYDTSVISPCGPIYLDMLMRRSSSNANTFGAAWILLDYSAGAGAFWIVFTQQLDSKLNNAKSTCLINFKFSCKINFYKNIRVKFRWKTPSMRKVIRSDATYIEFFLHKYEYKNLSCCTQLSGPKCFAKSVAA